jgi:hypothetical protein
VLQLLCRRQSLLYSLFHFSKLLQEQCGEKITFQISRETWMYAPKRQSWLRYGTAVMNRLWKCQRKRQHVHAKVSFWRCKDWTLSYNILSNTTGICFRYCHPAGTYIFFTICLKTNFETSKGELSKQSNTCFNQTALSCISSIDTNGSTRLQVDPVNPLILFQFCSVVTDTPLTSWPKY